MLAIIKNIPYNFSSICSFNIGSRTTWKMHSTCTVRWLMFNITGFDPSFFVLSLPRSSLSSTYQQTPQSEASRVRLKDEIGFESERKQKKGTKLAFNCCCCCCSFRSIGWILLPPYRCGNTGAAADNLLVVRHRRKRRKKNQRKLCNASI